MSLLSLLIVNLAFAAIPPKQALISARELLSMPEENRYQITEGQEQYFYPGVLEIAKDESQAMAVRWKAVTLVSKLKSKSSLKDLKSFLNSKDWFMRNAALISLDSVSKSEGRTAAKKLLTDKALVVRSAAVQVLSQSMDREIRDLFWEEMESKQNFRSKQSLWVRPQMLKALSDNPQKNEVALFVKHLEDKDLKVQESSMLALETLSQKKFDGKNLAQKRDLWKKWARTSDAKNL